MLIIVKTYNTQTHPLGTVDFFMREVGLVGFGGGHSKKIGLKGRASRKKLKERRGESDEKIRLKIG